MESVFYETDVQPKYKIKVGDALKYADGLYVVINDYGTTAHKLMKVGAKCALRSFSTLNMLREQIEPLIRKGDVVHYPSNLYQLDIQISLKRE